MSDNEHGNPLAKYNTALDLIKYEADISWKVFGAFLLSQTVFLAFLLQKSKTLFDEIKWEPTVWVAALIGILLCFPWYATHLRRTEWYRFRMAQARREEPNDFNLIKGDAENLSDGEPICIANRPFRIPCLGRTLRDTRSVPLLIAVFFTIYFIVLVLKGPWWACG